MRRKTLTLVLLVGALTFAGVAQAEETPWSLEGEAVTADSCSIGCPCILGEAPQHGHCDFVGIFQITKGNYGDLSLDGAKFGLAGEFVREKGQAEQTYHYVAYYVDSEAEKPQREALRAILSGPAFAPLGKPSEFEEAPIHLKGMDNFGKAGQTYGGTIGEIATVMVTPIEGAKTGEPMVIQNSAEPLFNWTCLGKAKGHYYSLGGKKFDYDGSSGESHRFAFGSGG